MEELRKNGIVLTICDDGGDPDGATCLVTHNTKAVPENPHSVESLMEISQ
jgi:hypothetical protein